MGAERDHYSWLEDFSLVLTRQAIRRSRRDPKYEVFAGSKPLAILWLTIVTAIAGAFGGTLVSGALWRSLLQVPSWLVAFIAFCVVVRRLTLALSGSYVAFLAGWCIGWGLLIGICGMWAAQLSSSGWAYGIALGIGFLIGITQGGYEPEDIQGHDSFFALGMLSAPGGACLAAWLHRNVLGDPATLAAAAITGAVAGLVFLGPVMTLLLVRLNNVEGLKRLASLLLHSDDTVEEAIPLFDAAIRLSPDNAELIGRRALAHALVGRDAEAEADWTRLAGLAPNSRARAVAEGWVHLRRDRPAEAAACFEKVAGKRKRDVASPVGLGIARLRLGDAAGAIAALEMIDNGAHDALSLTYLAEAQLAAGDPRLAEQTATTAIEELDSIHGRSWLVRGDALRAMGDLDGAAKDYNRALADDDEVGIEERGLAKLEEIDWPIEEYEPE